MHTYPLVPLDFFPYTLACIKIYPYVLSIGFQLLLFYLFIFFFFFVIIICLMGFNFSFIPLLALEYTLMF